MHMYAEVIVETDMGTDLTLRFSRLQSKSVCLLSICTSFIQPSTSLTIQCAQMNYVVTPELIM